MKRTLTTLRSRFLQWRYNRGSQIKYYNFWGDQKPEEMWFTQFIKAHFPDKKLPRINFTSVLGAIENIQDNHNGINIFYTGENLHADRFAKQLNKIEHQHYDLTLGFDIKRENKYMRLPIWVLWCFPPDADMQTIAKKVQAMRYPNVDNRNMFCCMICSHDQSGIRGHMMDALSGIASVTSAGRFRQNTHDLQSKFNDDKVAYMRQFRFAICPENSDREGYVTKKIFDAISSGCIPVYRGSQNNPEPAIVNTNAVLLWDPQGDNHELLELVNTLEHQPSAYQEFAKQPRLTAEAENIVWGYYEDLHNQMKNLLG